MRSAPSEMRWSRKCSAIMAVVAIFVAGAAEGDPIYWEGFDDDFIAGNSVPDLVDPTLSTAFTQINEHTWSVFEGKLTLRDRAWDIPGGEGGGFPPAPEYGGNASLDFSAGGGSYITFGFSDLSGPHYIEYIVVGYGGDSGDLFKFISADGINWTQVGDNSDEIGIHTFDLDTSGDIAYFRLQSGNSNGAYDGVWVDDFKVFVPEPSTAILLAGGLIGLAAAGRRRLH